MTKKGMTLIEVLTVIAFIAIITGIGIGGILKYRQTSELSGETGELVNDLRYAKQMSITEQIHYIVRFSFFNNSYQIIKYDEEEEIIKTKFFPIGTEIEEIENYSEVKFTLFGAVFKSGKVLLKGKDFYNIIEIKPAGVIYVQRNDFN